MHKKFLFLVLCLCASLQLSACKQRSIEIENAYAFPVFEAGRNTAAFFTLTNHSRDTFAIIGATSPLSDRVELHTHMMDEDGIMMMRQVDYLVVESKNTLVLQPSGHHIMLFNIKKKLDEGETFPITLEKRDGSSIEVEVTVKIPQKRQEP